ncbi:hypothetical protein PO909_030914 [Leuciscus waleckii]
MEQDGEGLMLTESLYEAPRITLPSKRNARCDLDMGDLVGFKEFGYRGINWCLFKLAAGTPMPLLPCTNENGLDSKIFSLILHIFAGDNPNMSRFKAYENLDRRCSQLSAHLKSDLLTFDFLMSIMGLHGFSPAPWIAEINAFNGALTHGKVGLCPSV